MPPAGEGITFFANQMLNLGYDMKFQEVKQQNTALTTEKQVSLATSANNLISDWHSSDYKALVDPDTSEDLGKRTLDNHIGKEKDKINLMRAENPHLANKFDEMAAHQEIVLGNALTQIRRVKLKEYNIAQAQEFIKSESIGVQANPNEKAVDDSINTVHDKINELVSNGSIGADHAMNLRQSYYKDVGEGLIINHPAGADLFFAKYKDQFSPIVLKQFNDQLAKARKKDEVTQALVDLKTRYIDNEEESQYGKGILGALNEIESADFMAKHGEEQTRIIQSSMVTQWRRSEDAYKAGADEITGKLLSKIENGDITKDDILTSGLRTSDQARVISWWNTDIRNKRAEMRMQATEGRERRRELKQAIQEKSEAIAGTIYSSIANGDDVSIEDIYNQIPQGLNPTTARGIAGGLKKLQKDPSIKDAIKVIDTFAKARGFDSDPVKNVVARGNAINDLMTAQKDEGLTGKTLIDRAEQIVIPHKSSWIKGLLNSMFYTGGYLDKIGGNVPQVATPAPVKTVTIDGKEYQDGDFITKDGRRYQVKVK